MKIICSQCGEGPIVCQYCGSESLTGVHTRNTNNGFANAQNLVYWLNTQTQYSAEREPKAVNGRPSGAAHRPDIKITHKLARFGDPFILVERQEQNVSGTGSEKIANKIQKALNAVRDLKVKRYYVVIAGDRVDLLKRAADDAFKSGTYEHERVVVIEENDFKELAKATRL
jgi:hypothetical protein